MIKAKYLYGFVVMVLCWTEILPAWAEGVKVVQPRTILSYITGAAPDLLSISIETSKKSEFYDFSLEPEFDIRHRLIVLTLALHRPGQEASAPNLLYENPNWLGYQPFIFAASDFVSGASKSLYGKCRKIDLEKLGFEVRIEVEKAVVNAIPETVAGGYRYQFDELKLQITVRNSELR
jgi:hypothetical protein